MKIARIVVSFALCGVLSTCKEEPPAPSKTATLPAAPLGGSTATPQPLRLLVIGEGFSTQRDFDVIVDSVGTALRGLPGAAADGSSVVIESKLAGARSGVVHTNSSVDCYFKADSAVLASVRAEKPANFDPQRYLVIVNEAGQGQGCSYGDVMFIAKDSGVLTVMHEMGHGLAGLYDERGSKLNAPRGRASRNCSSSPAYWLREFPHHDKNCDEFFFLLRPVDNCIMQSPYFSDFCYICAKHMTCALHDGQLGGCPEGPPPSFPPSLRKGKTTGLDVEAVIDRSGTITALRAHPVNLNEVRPQVITGDFFMVIRDGDEIVGIAPLSMMKADGKDDGRFQLTARAYGPRHTETTVPADSRLIRFTIAGVTREDLTKHQLTLDLRRIDDARKSFFLDDATVSTVSAAAASPPYQLQSALKDLPP